MQHFQPDPKPPISTAGRVEWGFAEADYRVKLPCAPSRVCSSVAGGGSGSGRRRAVPSPGIGPALLGASGA